MVYSHVVTYCSYLFKNTDCEKFKSNLSDNWYLPITAAAYFCLNVRWRPGWIISLILALCFITFIAGTTTSIYKNIKGDNRFVLTCSFFSSFGVCIENGVAFYEYWHRPVVIIVLERVIHSDFDIVKILAMLGSIISIVFVFIFVHYVLSSVYKLIYNVGVIESLSTSEKITYVLIGVVLLGITVVAFSVSEAFYGTNINYDIIYTSDSPNLVKGKVFVHLMHPENDLRQPLFALFAAPFSGISYLVGRLIHAPAFLSAILVNLCQIVLLMISSLILASMLKILNITLS